MQDVIDLTRITPLEQQLVKAAMDALLIADQRGRPFPWTVKPGRDGRLVLHHGTEA
jgi:hypothetical protein